MKIVDDMPTSGTFMAITMYDNKEWRASQLNWAQNGLLLVCLEGDWYSHSGSFPDGTKYIVKD